jgi:peptide/nickel transport system ATP-binding protein
LSPAIICRRPHRLSGGQKQRVVLEGEIPSALSPPRGCAFHTRCHRKIGPRCETEKPADRGLSEEATGLSVIFRR